MSSETYSINIENCLFLLVLGVLHCVFSVHVHVPTVCACMYQYIVILVVCCICAVLLASSSLFHSCSCSCLCSTNRAAAVCAVLAVPQFQLFVYCPPTLAAAGGVLLQAQPLMFPLDVASSSMAGRTNRPSSTRQLIFWAS